MLWSFFFSKSLSFSLVIAPYVEARADTVLDLNNPKVLENLTIAMTKLRQEGQVLGGEEYAR